MRPESTQPYGARRPVRRAVLLQVPLSAHPWRDWDDPALHIPDACRVPLGACLTLTRSLAVGGGGGLAVPFSVSHRSRRQSGLIRAF